MAVSVLGTSLAGSATATSWTITTPSQMAVGTTTIVQVGSTNADTSAFTKGSDWLEPVDGKIGIGGVYAGSFLLNNLGGVSTLIRTDDQPSTTITGFGTASSVSCGRNASAVTIGGGTIRATARSYHASIASNTTANTSSGTRFRNVIEPGTSAGWGAATNACVSGDKAVIMLATQRYSVSPVLNSGGTMSLTNLTKVAESQATASGQMTMQIWTADVGATVATSVSTAQTVSITNPTGAAGSYALNIFIIKATPVPEGGAIPRVMVVGDSITAGSAFYSSAAQTGDRYIDLLFGNQVGATFVAGGTVAAITFSAAMARTADAANAIGWYVGSYTPYDGTPTTTVHVRNGGTAGWDGPQWIKYGWAVGDVGNPTSGGYAPDILIVNLGANDERGLTDGPNTAGNLRDAAIAMATAYSGASHVVLVKQWPWAYDYVTGSTFPRTSGEAHSAYHSAIDTAATQITAAGKTCVVADLTTDASTSGGTDFTTWSGSLSRYGAVGSSGTVDNVHPSATAYSTMWAPAIRTALDQLTILNPLTGPSISVGGASAPTATLGRTPQLVKAGASTPTGSTSRNRAVIVAVAGAVAAVGALLRRTATARTAGGVTGAGAPVKLTDMRSASGTLTPSATLARIKALLRTVTGASTPTGALVRRPGPLRAGASTPTGTQTRRPAKGTAGAATSTGVRITRVNRLAAGAMTPTATLAAIKTVLLSLAGSMTATATLAADVLTTLIQQSLSAALSSASTLTRSVSATVTATFTPSGTAAKSTALALAGAVTATGAAVAEIAVVAALRILRRVRRPDFTRSGRRESTT